MHPAPAAARDRKSDRQACAPYSGNTSWRGLLRLLSKPHRVDRRQRMRHAGPAVALVLADPQSSSRRAHGEAVSGLVERQRMAIDDIVGVLLRQPLAQNV